MCINKQASPRSSHYKQLVLSQQSLVVSLKSGFCASHSPRESLGKARNGIKLRKVTGLTLFIAPRKRGSTSEAMPG